VNVSSTTTFNVNLVLFELQRVKASWLYRTILIVRILRTLSHASIVLEKTNINSVFKVKSNKQRAHVMNSSFLSPLGYEDLLRGPRNAGKEKKTYNNRYSLVVTHPITNLPI